MADQRCALCGTPIPWSLRRRKGRAGRYCCTGCLHVAEILAAVPDDQGRRMLEQARRMGIVPAAGSDAEAAMAAEAALAERGAAGDAVQGPAGAGQAERAERFLVEGFACPACAWLVATVLWRQSGVLDAEADFLSDSVRLRYDMRRTGPDALAAAVGRFGYGLEVLGAADSPEEALFSRLLTRFVLAMFLALNAMMLSAVHWAAYLEIVPPVDLEMIAIVQLVLVAPLLWLGVWPLFKRSLQLIRMGRPSMDLLFVLGFGAAFGLSLAAFFTPDSRFYFDVCGAFVAISLFGRLVEGKLRLRAARELRGLLNLSAAKVAALAPAGDIRYLAVDQVEPGQRIRIEAGRTVPFDGALLGEQPRLVSEAMLTGEPTPVLKRPGEELAAGSETLGDGVEMRVTRPYREGRLQQIADGIAQALTRNELRLRSADRLAAWFVPLVLLVAGLTFGLRWALLDAGPLAPEVWMPTIAVLLVACPCAFGIATASALAVAVSALLRRGILVKDGGALERLDAVDVVALDKTGTLTDGRWRIERVVWFGAPDDGLLAAVAGAEAGIDHPVAHALRGFLIGESGLEPVAAEAVALQPGRGLIARVAGGELRLGSAGLFERLPAVAGLSDRSTPIYFGRGPAAAGCFLLSDGLRPEAAAVVRALRRRGLEPVVLSGDRQAVVGAVAAELGIRRAEGGLTPEDKRERVRHWAAQGHRVVFCGDGTNDAPAMAEAEVAVALRHGTDLARSAAHALPLTGDLAALEPLFAAAARTHRTMWRNFFWAFGYNALFLPLAAFGYLHPIFAAGLMFASSVTVLINSLRLRPALERDRAREEREGEVRRDRACGVDQAHG